MAAAKGNKGRKGGGMRSSRTGKPTPEAAADDLICEDCIDMPGTDVHRTCPKHSPLAPIAKCCVNRTHTDRTAPPLRFTDE